MKTCTFYLLLQEQCGVYAYTTTTTLHTANNKKKREKDADLVLGDKFLGAHGAVLGVYKQLGLELEHLPAGHLVVRPALRFLLPLLFL